MLREKKIKVAIAVLSALLVASVFTLLLTYRHGISNDRVAVGNNLINVKSCNFKSNNIDTSSNVSLMRGSFASDSDSNQGTSRTVRVSSTSTSSEPAAKIVLNTTHPEENVPFSAGNMFPGDSETNSYRIFVSTPQGAALCFSVKIDSGFEKLAEVLKIRVALPDSNEVLYDGLMRDMPSGVACDVSVMNTDILYQVTAYLDTSVGNDYQNANLTAVFSWWLEELDDDVETPSQEGGSDSGSAGGVGGLKPTGDAFNIVLCIVLFATSACLFILCVKLRRKRGARDE